MAHQQHRARGGTTQAGLQRCLPQLEHEELPSAIDKLRLLSIPAEDKRRTDNQVNLVSATALHKRNERWSTDPRIPSWVDCGKVGLDQFFTRPEIAKSCHASLLETMKKDGADTSAYEFIEPSAGTGNFFNLLPQDRRVGIDLVPYSNEIICSDFLAWQPKKPGRYAVVGNPPFGYRAWLALNFINHAALFSDYVGFILPMSFQSYGKGSPRFRVEGLELKSSTLLPQDSFTDAGGKQVKINALWQVWKRGVNNSMGMKTCNNWLDLFTVDMRKERLCGQNRMTEADYFLQRTFYKKSPPQLVKNFRQVRYVCGYGLVIKKDFDKVLGLLSQVNWERYSNLAAHNCRHISMYHIRKVLTDNGLVDCA